ncbi:hypothetical protein GN244_ATG00928 [Phytophthora infestans]|uniref:Uncharacterized protein n=1 Tax=Phytophthora infestans TaxID=4787 RepID=A0A833TFI3_PHYIN|nr:hypothetical protein GN244_ATG00928 [Phytophthora infestans]
MVKRSNPEVVARLRQRRKQRERARNHASSNSVDEEWLVDAFISGMSNKRCATLVRGHRSWTFNEAVNAALDQVGEYCESYGVDLGTVMKVQDERDAAVGVVSVLVPDVTMMLYSSVITGNGNSGVKTGPPPRYDTGVAQAGGQWEVVVPTGYRLVPTDANPGGYGADTAAEASAHSQGRPPQSTHGQRSDDSGKHG